MKLLVQFMKHVVMYWTSLGSADGPSSLCVIYRDDINWTVGFESPYKYISALQLFMFPEVHVHARLGAITGEY